MTELISLLEMLSSPDNNIRSEAEQLMKTEWSSRPEIFIPSLSSLIVEHHQPNATIPSFAAVLLRREISKNPTFPKESICPALLDAFSSGTTSKTLRKRIGDVIAEIASQTDGQFTLLLQMVKQIITGREGGDSCDDFLMISSALELISSSPTTFLSSPEVLSCIPGFLVREETLLAAFKASVNLMINATSTVLGHLASTFIPIYPSMLGVATQTCTTKDDGVLLSAVLEEMLEFLAWEYENDCLTTANFSEENWITSVFECLMTPLSAEDLSSETKEMILETLTSFIEVLPSLFVASKRRHKGGNVALQTYLDCLIKLVASSICAEDDHPGTSEWYLSCGDNSDGGANTTNTNDDDYEEESISQFAEGMLDRISITLVGNNTIITWMHRTIPLYYLSSDWRQRWAALRSLASMAEGANEGMVRGGDGGLEGTLLHAVLSEIIWPSFQDQHPRVQYAGCHALGQLCSDFSGLIQSKWAKQSLDVIGSLFLSTPHPRLQSHSAAALINFSDDCFDAIHLLSGAMPQLLQRMISLLLDEGSPPFLREQILATLSSLQSCCPSSFKKDAFSLMDVYISILMGMSDKKNNTFCRSLEAATVLLEVVDPWKDLCPSRHLEPLITKIMVPIQEALVSSSIEENYSSDIEEYLSAAWIRVACSSSLSGVGEGGGGNSFSIAPYLPLILPHLIKTASQEADLAIIEASPGSLDPEGERLLKEEELKSSKSGAGWEFESSASGKRIGINTTVLEAKESSLEALNVWITSLNSEDWVASYYGILLETILPLCNFLLHVGVQQAAIQCLVSMVRQTGNQLESSPLIIDTLLSSLEEDPDSLESWDLSLLCTFVDAIADLISLSLKKNDRNNNNDNDKEDILCLVKDTVVTNTTYSSSSLNPNIIERGSRVMDCCIGIIRKIKRSRRSKRKEEDEEDFLTDSDSEIEDASSLFYSLGRLFLATMKLSTSSSLTTTSETAAFPQSTIERNMKFWEFVGECSMESEDVQGGGAALFQHPSICHIDDILLHYGTPLYQGYVGGSSFCLSFIPFIHKALMSGVVSLEGDVRQASIYGIGISSIGGRGTEIWTSFIAPIFPHLLAFIDCADSRSLEMVKCTENAMSAIARICLSSPEMSVASLRLKDILPRWIVGLPVNNDDDESPLIYSFLVNAFRIDNGSLIPVLMGENGENGAHLLRSLLDSLSRSPSILGPVDLKMIDMGSANGAVVSLRSQVKQLALALKDRLPAQAVEAAISGFSEEQLSALN